MFSYSSFLNFLNLCFTNDWPIFTLDCLIMTYSDGSAPLFASKGQIVIHEMNHLTSLKIIRFVKMFLLSAILMNCLTYRQS